MTPTDTANSSVSGDRDTVASSTAATDGSEDHEQLSESVASTVTAKLARPLPATHPLRDTWTLWYDGGGKVNSADWGGHVKAVCDIETVEEFWGYALTGTSCLRFSDMTCARVVNNIDMPSNIPTGSNYHLFKHGIRPEWEDDANALGGRWQVMLSKKIPREDYDNFWLHLVCLLSPCL